MWDKESHWAGSKRSDAWIWYGGIELYLGRLKGI